jgi:hypothetical protein
VKKRVIGIAAVEQPDVTRIDESRLKRLLQLCHPDKHAGSPLATETFHWLQEVRKELDKRKSGR